MRKIQKKAKKVYKIAQLWIFTPHFSKFRAFRTPHPPKLHVLSRGFLVDKAFYFSKRALRANIARSKLLK